MDESTPLLRILGHRGLRRALLVPASLLVGLVLGVAGPLVLATAVVVDLLGRRRFAGTRAVIAVVTYAVAEALGVLGAGWVWLRWGIGRPGSAAYLEANHRLARRWGGGLLRMVLWTYGARLEVEGLDQIRDASGKVAGPFLLLSRHVSLLDTLLPLLLLGDHGLRPRYVMKAALKLDPMLDLLSTRTPHAMVTRHSADTQTQVRAVARLAEDLGQRDCVVIFPEGTRFSPKKRARVLRSLERRGDPARLAQARSLVHTLPPRAGGPLALLRAAPHADVVVCAHVGMEGMGAVSDVLRGSLIGGTVRVRLWRVPAVQIPRDPDQQLAWLHELWAELDRWVCRHARPAPA